MSTRIGDWEGLTLRDLISERTVSGGVGSGGIESLVFGPLWRISLELLTWITCVTKEGIWSCSRRASRILGEDVWARFESSVDNVFRDETSKPTTTLMEIPVVKYYKARRAVESRDLEAMLWQFLRDAVGHYSNSSNCHQGISQLLKPRSSYEVSFRLHLVFLKQANPSK